MSWSWHSPLWQSVLVRWYILQRVLSQNKKHWKHWPVRNANTIKSIVTSKQSTIPHESVRTDKLTSNGCVVALAMPWLSLLVMLDPLLTCGPAPRTLCNTLKALASDEPITAPSHATNAWTRAPPLCVRISPAHKPQRFNIYYTTEQILSRSQFLWYKFKTLKQILSWCTNNCS